MGRDTQGNQLEFPACNLSGNVWFETDLSPEEIRRKLESSLGISFEDAATEPGEYSYDSLAFGFDIGLRIISDWPSGTLCWLLAMSNSNHGIYDFDAPVMPFERHLAKLVEVYELGRLISHEEVKRRRKEARGSTST
jgi:hypothetical protein